MLVICNVCGTSFETQDDCVCPNCGALTYTGYDEIDTFNDIDDL